MKRTNFFPIHQERKAKIVDFAGFEMPVQYSKGTLQEHLAVRKSVGVFDVSHMGEVEVRGEDALAFVQQITVNNVAKLEKGKAQYSAMCYADGGIVDDLLVYHCGDYYMLVINGACIDKDVAWMQSNAEDFDKLELLNVSEEINLLAVQGPQSLATLQKLTETDLEAIAFYNFTFGKLAGVDMIISRTGYTGELGFELYFRGDEELAAMVWNAIFDAGEEFGIEPVGLAARDTLRLEKGYCLYGNDIDESTTPIEGGLGWITKTKKGPFNGRDAIVKQKEEGLTRKLVGLVVKAERFIAREGYRLTADGSEIGRVTSGNISPILGQSIAMGYVTLPYTEPGTIVHIKARGKEFPAEVRRPPFVE